MIRRKCRCSPRLRWPTHLPIPSSPGWNAHPMPRSSARPSAPACSPIAAQAFKAVLLALETLRAVAGRFLSVQQQVRCLSQECGGAEPRPSAAALRHSTIRREAIARAAIRAGFARVPFRSSPTSVSPRSARPATRPSRPMRILLTMTSACAVRCAPILRIAPNTAGFSVLRPCAMSHASGCSCTTASSTASRTWCASTRSGIRRRRSGIRAAQTASH